MSKPHGIAWLNMPGFRGETLNPITGCTPCSPGCDNCYASELHNKRHKAYLEGKLQQCPQYSTPFEEVRFWPERIDQLKKWRSPRMVFVNSMSDLFHPNVPSCAISNLIYTADRTPQHIIVVLTKRPKRMSHWELAHNMWAGVTVCNQAELPKLDILREIPAAKRFVSIEPLLEGIGEINLDGIDWVIVGGESGVNARKCEPNWIRTIVEQCQNASVPVFVKQMGSMWDRCVDHQGGYWGPGLNVREWPAVTP